MVAHGVANLTTRAADNREDRGPVLVRLTCGCSGCDKELAYFQALHEAYKNAGLVSLAVFKEPDAKVAAYVREKKLNMLYAVDTKGESWNVFETKTMPTNFLIDKGGKIVSVAAGCDPSGLMAKKRESSGSVSVNVTALPGLFSWCIQDSGLLPNRVTRTSLQAILHRPQNDERARSLGLSR